MKPLHKLDKYDDGRFSPTPRSYYASELDEGPVSLCAKLIPLFASQDPEDRREAHRLVYLLKQMVYCPDGVWVVKSRYAKDPRTGKRWAEHEVIWSAHLTEAEALRWHRCWCDYWRAKRADYEMLPVCQQDKVELHYLRHPDAEVDLHR
jgi:hypothetical protein